MNFKTNILSMSNHHGQGENRQGTGQGLDRFELSVLPKTDTPSGGNPDDARAANSKLRSAAAIYLETLEDLDLQQRLHKYLESSGNATLSDPINFSFSRYGDDNAIYLSVDGYKEVLSFQPVLSEFESATIRLGNDITVKADSYHASRTAS